MNWIALRFNSKTKMILPDKHTRKNKFEILRGKLEILRSKLSLVSGQVGIYLFESNKYIYDICCKVSFGYFTLHYCMVPTRARATRPRVEAKTTLSVWFTPMTCKHYQVKQSTKGIWSRHGFTIARTFALVLLVIRRFYGIMNL